MYPLPLWLCAKALKSTLRNNYGFVYLSKGYIWQNKFVLCWWTYRGQRLGGNKRRRPWSTWTPAVLHCALQKVSPLLRTCLLVLIQMLPENTIIKPWNQTFCLRNTKSKRSKPSTDIILDHFRFGPCSGVLFAPLSLMWKYIGSGRLIGLPVQLVWVGWIQLWLQIQNCQVAFQFWAR